MEDKTKKGIAIAVAVVVLLVIGALVGMFVYSLQGEEEAGYMYLPTRDLPEHCIIVVDTPTTFDEMAAVAAISSLAVRTDVYNPLFVLENGALNAHELFTLTTMDGNTDPILMFSNNADTANTLASQASDLGLSFDPDTSFFPLTGDVAGTFRGFSGAITVGTYSEALWVAPLAHVTNRVVVRIDDGTTYSSQEEVWADLALQGVPCDYVVITNPYDMNVEVLKQMTPGYYTPDYNGNDAYPYQDELYHIDALSCLAGEVAAMRNAYVITQYSPSQDAIGYMDPELNQRAIGYWEVLRNLSVAYQVPEYVCLVGSAAAVPQFQLPDTTSDDPSSREGDGLVSCDVGFGFLDTDDPSSDFTMDSAVGRIVNLNLAGGSNSLARTYAFERMTLETQVQYQDGPRTVDWSRHGASFSGYQITYQRMQSSPGRFICHDYEDEGLEYEYIAPTGLENVLPLDPGRKLTRTNMKDMNAVMQASGYIAYRGHGSDYNSLYLTPYMWGNENAVLRGEEVRELFLPPQVGFYVSCMNSKIHGGGWASHPDPVTLDKLFGLNCLYAGAVVHGGATEVSYSNTGQDVSVAKAEANPANDNYNWDKNDAWYAFFWDGILDHEEEHGTVGKAIQWAENRYIANHDDSVSPFMQANGNPDWKEVAMFVIYADPAFQPYSYKPGANDYDKWHNGPDDQ